MNLFGEIRRLVYFGYGWNTRNLNQQNLVPDHLGHPVQSSNNLDNSIFELFRQGVGLPRRRRRRLGLRAPGLRHLLRPLLLCRAVGDGAADERGLRHRRRHHPGQRRVRGRKVQEETMSHPSRSGSVPPNSTEYLL